MNLLHDAYRGETCYMLATGPSLGEAWDETVREKLSGELVIAAKQALDVAEGIADFHILNSWNYKPYQYRHPRPIIALERADDDPPTPGVEPDLLFRIPDPRNFYRRLATTYEFDHFLLTKTLDRPWGPGVLYELGFYLAVHLGVRDIITLGWDLGQVNSPVMEHFFKENQDVRDGSDGVLNKPRIRSYEVADIARSTRALYYWLRSKGIYLHVVSERSLVDAVVPRVSLRQEFLPRWQYSAELLANGSFFERRGEELIAWVPTPSSSGVQPLSPGEGVRLVPTGRRNETTSLFQNIRTEPFFAGSKLTVTMEGIAREPAKAVLVLALFVSPQDRYPQVFTSELRGTGTWESTSLETILPASLNLSHLKVCVTLRPGARSPLVVRSISASLEK